MTDLDLTRLNSLAIIVLTALAGLSVYRRHKGNQRMNDLETKLTNDMAALAGAVRSVANAVQAEADSANEAIKTLKDELASAIAQGIPVDPAVVQAAIGGLESATTQLNTIATTATTAAAAVTASLATPTPTATTVDPGATVNAGSTQP